MYGRVLKPSLTHNAALNSVQTDADTEKLLIHAKETNPRASSIEDFITSLISPVGSDAEALARMNLVGCKLIPYLINVVFHGKNPVLATSDATLSLERILSLPIIIEEVDRYETLVRYLIDQAYSSQNTEAQIYTMDLLLAICKRDENKTLLADFPGLTKLSIQVIRTASEEELIESAISIMWVLASKDVNKSLLIEPSIIDFFAEICSDEKYASIQLLTVDILRLLSESGMHEGFLVAYRGGILLDLLHNLSKDVRRRSVAISALYTISNLITHRTYSHIFMYEPDLLITVAMHAADCCVYGIVHAASGVIDKFADFMDATHPEHNTLLCALSIMFDSMTKCGIVMALYSMSTQAQRVINCSALALCKPLMKSLTKILMTTDDEEFTKPMILDILNQISSEPVSALLLMDHKLLIVEVLNLAKLSNHSSSTKVHELAVRVTLTMVSHKMVSVELAETFNFRIGFLV